MMTFVRCLVRTLLIVWASPGSLVGVTLGAIALLTGGKAQLHSGVLEFHGGAVRRMLHWLPIGPAAAITFGHVVLGQNGEAIEFTRSHERIHVRQYERWGPLFIPAYLLCSAWLWCRGKDAYRLNPFEVEAFANDGIRRS